MKCYLLLGLVLLLGGCEAPQSAPHVLEGEWMFRGYQNGYQDCGSDQVSLNIKKVGNSLELQGRSYVNTYFGSAKLSDEGSWQMAGALGTTKMAGSAVDMACEIRYYEKLSRTDSYKIEGNRLHLSQVLPASSSQVADILIFERK